MNRFRFYSAIFLSFVLLSSIYSLASARKLRQKRDDETQLVNDLDSSDLKVNSNLKHKKNPKSNSVKDDLNIKPEVEVKNLKNKAEENVITTESSTVIEKSTVVDNKPDNNQSGLDDFSQIFEKVDLSEYDLYAKNKIIELNKKREENKLAPLKLDIALTSMAQIEAERLAGLDKIDKIEFPVDHNNLLVNVKRISFKLLPKNIFVGTSTCYNSESQNLTFHDLNSECDLINKSLVTHFGYGRQYNAIENLFVVYLFKNEENADNVIGKGSKIKRDIIDLNKDESLYDAFIKQKDKVLDKLSDLVNIFKSD